MQGNSSSSKLMVSLQGHRSCHVVQLHDEWPECEVDLHATDWLPLSHRMTLVSYLSSAKTIVAVYWQRGVDCDSTIHPTTGTDGRCAGQPVLANTSSWKPEDFVEAMLSVFHCWEQLAHLDLAENARVFLNSITSLYRYLMHHIRTV